MIDPLLSDSGRESPSWVSWLAHVRLLTFVLRYSFSVADADRLDHIVRDYDMKFELAHGPEYRRPKHHQLRHLKKYLVLFGPFRFYWCMSGEAFLQRLKRLLEMTNYQTAPQTVLTLWAQQRVLRRHPSYRHDSDPITYAGNLLVGLELVDQVQTSQLLSHALTMQDHLNLTSARYVRCFKRDMIEVQVGDWVMVSSVADRHVQHIARVLEMAVLTVASGSWIRMWCGRVDCPVHENSAAMIVTPKNYRFRPMMVCLERVNVTVLSCHEREEVMEYRYVL